VLTGETEAAVHIKLKARLELTRHCEGRCGFEQKSKGDCASAMYEFLESNKQMGRKKLQDTFRGRLECISATRYMHPNSCKFWWGFWLRIN
jgi:hypothetical protein